MYPQTEETSFSKSTVRTKSNTLENLRQDQL